jgi:beta-galactosidase
MNERREGRADQSVWEDTLPRFPRLLHGADYYPEQWIGHPEILERDAELMREAGINCVSLGVFAWSSLEPEEGGYTFDWMAKTIDRLYAAGVRVILATPSGARPAWLAEKYPEVLRVSDSLTRAAFGGRHNHCYTSPVYREKVEKIDRKLAESFGGHPGVILWHISNEFGGACYCPLCRAAFREWLKKKYESLETLNEQWYTAFWSHRYTKWEQIDPPLRTGETRLHALNLDWKRFVTDRTLNFYRNEAGAVRSAAPDLPVTTNMIGFQSNLNYGKFRDDVDVVGWDSYPLWHKSAEDDLRVAREAAFTHDYMRSLKHKPFLLMESTPSTANWMEVSRLKRPGMHMLSSLQAVAHGSNSVQYFQWRQSRGACEKFHSAVVGHSGRSDTMIFRDVKAVGDRLAALDRAGLSRTQVRPEAALLFDWENRWALKDAQGPRRGGIHYDEIARSFYRAFWELGIPTDVVDMERDLSRYRLIVAPMLYLCRAGIQEKLKDFVRAGGVLAGTYWSGVVNENDLCYLGDAPGGMTELFGLRREDIDALYDGQYNRMEVDPKADLPLAGEYRVSELCELDCREGAEVLAEYGGDFYRGRPALTVNSYGAGRAYYLAARAEYAFTKDFVSLLAGQAGVQRSLDAKLPAGVTAERRTGPEKDFIFVQNFNPGAAEVALGIPYRDAENGTIYEKTLSLAGYEVKILEGKQMS